MGLMDGFIPEPEYHDESADTYHGQFGVGQCLWCGLFFQKSHPSDNCCEPCFDDKAVHDDEHPRRCDRSGPFG